MRLNQSNRQSRTLSTAIAPPTLSQQGETRYELESISYGDLSNENLDGLDAVWLLDPPPLSAEQWNQLLTMVDAGGGLAIAMGSNAGMTPEVFNATASTEIMPAELLRQWRGNLYLAPSRLEHPILQRFKTREGSIPWRENPVFKIWEVGPLTEESRVVIPYNNGKPALIARDLGRGRVLLLTTSLSAGEGRPWNELLAPREMAWPGFCACRHDGRIPCWRNGCPTELHDRSTSQDCQCMQKIETSIPIYSNRPQVVDVLPPMTRVSKSS